MDDMALAAAQRLIAQALADAQANFGRPISVAIVDRAGFLLAFARQDGAPLRGIAISEGKAYSAARLGVTTQAFLERVRREQIEVGYFCDPRLTALPGGAPLKDAAGQVLGAVGISGLTSAEDQQIADRLAHSVAQE